MRVSATVMALSNPSTRNKPANVAIAGAKSLVFRCNMLIDLIFVLPLFLCSLILYIGSIVNIKKARLLI